MRPPGRGTCCRRSAGRPRISPSRPAERRRERGDLCDQRARPCVDSPPHVVGDVERRRPAVPALGARPATGRRRPADRARRPCATAPRQRSPAAPGSTDHAALGERLPRHRDVIDRGHGEQVGARRQPEGERAPLTGSTSSCSTAASPHGLRTSSTATTARAPRRTPGTSVTSSITPPNTAAWTSSSSASRRPSVHSATTRRVRRRAGSEGHGARHRQRVPRPPPTRPAGRARRGDDRRRVMPAASPARSAR